MAFFLGFLGLSASAFSLSICSRACFRTSGWNTASASSRLVILDACFDFFAIDAASAQTPSSAAAAKTAREIRGMKFANVREGSLDSIWFQSEAFNKFRGTDWLPEPCQSKID